MMDRLSDRFEAHPIVEEFLGIIQSGMAMPNAPKFLHRALARAAVSLLPSTVRTKLALGDTFDLTTADRLTLNVVGRLAERRGRPSITSLPGKRSHGPAERVPLPQARRAGAIAAARRP